MQNHENMRHALPAGYISKDPANISNRERSIWSWGAFILPYVEEEALHNELQVSRRSLAENLATPTGLIALQTPLPLFVCPSDTGPDLNDFTEAYITNPWPEEAEPYRRLVTSNGTARLAIAKSNYVGVACSSVSLTPTVESKTYGPATGVFYQNSATRFNQIKDGTSHTLMIGERSFTTGEITVGAANALGFSPEVSGDRKGSSTSAIGIPYMDINRSEFNQNHQSRGFHSLHPGGAQFAMCDGSVHFISETIDNNWHTVPSPDHKNGKWIDSTLERLAAKADGELVGEF